jgi:hypothetical protein
LTPPHQTFGIFSYMNNNDLAPAWEKVRLAIIQEMILLEEIMGLTNAVQVWRDHEAAVFARFGTKASEFMLRQIGGIYSKLGPTSGANLAANEAAKTLYNTATELNKLTDPKLGKLVFHYDLPLQD